MVHALLHNPEPLELEAFLLEHLDSGCLVQVAGECEVVYEGTAASLAEAGDYLVMLKADGSLQVHGPKGMKPMNWQPKTDDLRVSIVEGRAVLTAQRRGPPELVAVTFLKPALAQALEPRDEGAFYLSGRSGRCRTRTRWP